jgi:putative FmdB family regulatory protein
MPTYSYRCTACDHAFDIQQAFSDDSLTLCPECSGALRKVFNTIGVTFQGSGFYRTDSRAEAKSAKTSASKSDSKSSQKPAKESSSSSSSGSSSSGSTSAKSTTTTKASPASS